MKINFQILTLVCVLAVVYLLGCKEDPPIVIEEPPSVPEFHPPPGSYLGARYITISTKTAGSTIRYTLDGSVPTATIGTAIANGDSIYLDTTRVLKAVAVAVGGTSELATGVYTFQAQVVAAPVFAPPGGSYQTARAVVISSATAGATIRYTIDGSEPTVSSGVSLANGDSITISTPSTTVKAIATKPGWQASAVTSALYTIEPVVAAPVFAPPGGSYQTARAVVISSATAGATIRYTIDGSEPTVSSGVSLANGDSITISTPSTTVKAIATKPGWQASAVTSALYTIERDAPILPDPLWHATAGPPFGTGVGAFLFGQNGHCFADFGSQMARSPDSGKTWVAVLSPKPFSSVVINKDGILYAKGFPVDGGGFYTSTDDGTSWSVRPFDYSAGGGMAVIRNGWLLSAYIAYCQRSTDAGLTWSWLPAQLPQDVPIDLSYDPIKGIAYALAKSSMAAHVSLYSSTDDGDSWSSVCSVNGYVTPIMTVDSKGGVWLVDNDGYVVAGPSFDRRGLLGVHTSALSAHDAFLVMAGGPDTKGFRLSWDGGRTFVTNNSGLSDNTWVTAIGICPGGTVLVGTQSGMIYRSTAPIAN